MVLIQKYKIYSKLNYNNAIMYQSFIKVILFERLYVTNLTQLLWIGYRTYYYILIIILLIKNVYYSTNGMYYNCCPSV